MAARCSVEQRATAMAFAFGRHTLLSSALAESPPNGAQAAAKIDADLEVRPLGAFRPVALGVFTRQEQFSTSRYWTLKECYIKGAAKGSRCRLTHFGST
jgi:hypothetical protein